MCVEFLPAAEAVKRIRSNSTIATGGFVSVGVPEEIEEQIEKTFLDTGCPNNLELYYAAGQGDGLNRALNHFAHKGLVNRVIGGHWGLVPKIQDLAVKNEVEAYNFPQGVISKMYRDAAAKLPWTITTVGLKTFVDPDVEGGKLNPSTTEDLVEKNYIKGLPFLFYKTPKLDYVILRGTYSDESGNISFEHEAATLDATAMATACKNNGGKVIVQVKRVTSSKSLDPRLVKIPSSLVDIVVPISDEIKYHGQSFNTYYDPSFNGETKVSLASIKPIPLNPRKIIARRAALEMKKDYIVNLGIGIPELVGVVMNEENQGHEMTLTVESGLVGGVPCGGQDFGAAINPSAILDQDRQFDFYDGGGLDITFLGLAQCDQFGNINVSKFGPKIAGCGGFINISQNTKNVIFCGTFTSSGFKGRVESGKLVIENEGSIKKFINNVEQITFSAEYAIEKGQRVLYVTERCVFQLLPTGLTLIEIAPGIDLEKDIIELMEFRPKISSDLKEMDPRIFNESPMNLSL